MLTEEIENQPTESSTETTAPAWSGAFNWETSGKSGDIYTPEERERLSKQYDDTLHSVVEHDIVEGKVVSVSDKDVLINIGFKSDGLVPLSEFKHMPDIKKGDKVEVYIETQEDKSGQLILSHKKARALKSWDRVNDALEKDEVITGL